MNLHEYLKQAVSLAPSGDYVSVTALLTRYASGTIEPTYQVAHINKSQVCRLYTEKTPEESLQAFKDRPAECLLAAAEMDIEPPKGDSLAM